MTIEAPMIQPEVIERELRKRWPRPSERFAQGWTSRGYLTAAQCIFLRRRWADTYTTRGPARPIWGWDEAASEGAL